ncbi:thiamine transporter 1-like [Palaemon carinicauda]|uniref:thiamine transporter 1-like n=1 Tax=Palaemon carinicauda TaxID=392227 RepID=UPI0035B62ABE
METWMKSCLVLCMYGFFKEFRPSEPFLTEYLIGPPMNLTLDEVNYDVYPVWTYAYLSQLIVVLLLTDFLRYKPMIIIEGAGYVATWCILLWTRGVHWMQFMEFCYGIATSTEVAYYTYIYARVSSEYYQRVTSFTRSAILFGKFTAAVAAQVLTSTELVNYHDLNYISLASVSIALIIACTLPPVQTSIYFHRSQLKVQATSESTTQLNASDVKENERKWLSNAMKLIWSDFKSAYTNKYLLKWSVWWAFATCGNFQVGNFIQPLWETIAPMDDTEVLYNGIVEAASTLLSALSAFAVGYFHLNWSLFGESTMAIISLLDALLLFFMGVTQNIWVGYVNYILFRASYQVMITIASYQVAKELRADSYGLVFGMNMFVALFLQTILTAIVIEALQIGSKLQFVLYGGYFGVLAFVFFVLSSYSCGRMGGIGCARLKEVEIWETSGPSQNELRRNSDQET